MSGPLPAAIEARAITKILGGRPIFRELSLRVRAGGGLLIQGPSGCGKTTLLRCLGLLERLDEGTVLLGGEIVSVAAGRPARERLGSGISIVFQQLHLWPHLRAGENVMLPLRLRFGADGSWREDAQRLMSRLGIWEKRSSFPVELSGGEQQRVAIARALAQSPRVLLLDEITSSLDGAISRQVYEEVAEAKGEDVAVVIVSHRDDVPHSLREQRISYEGSRWWNEEGEPVSAGSR